MRVLFRVAAGPRIGFGHLMRARSLARALGTAPLVSIRGTEETCRTAVRHGVEPQRLALDCFDGSKPFDLLVVDDPARDEAEPWVLAARQRGIPVVAVIDRGLAYVDADLVIDGSIEPCAGPRVLNGPMYAVIDPSIATARDLPSVERSGVLIALGGGAHVRAWGAAVARAIRRQLPDVRVRIAGGFTRPPSADDESVRWISAPHGLTDELRRAAVAVVAGGLTLYEAAALGAPIVGLAVVPEQQPAIAAFARRGAAMNAGIAGDAAALQRAADAVLTLVTHRQRAARFAAAASRLVDGRGAFRAADAIRQLARPHTDHSHAA
jgi:spore coat polysaccharide biosynthesis predicted glycosyltransferase SpsG